MHPFSKRRSETAAAWGEGKLIAAIRRWLGAASPPPPFGMGDDCAVVPKSRGRQLLKVDPVIYGRHFDDRVPAKAVGAKLLKRSLSDFAAMGGRPRAAVIALTLDPRVRIAWLQSFHRGLSACARRYGVSVVGGSVAQADGVLGASLTLLGDAPKRIITRRGARRGDWIYVTGLLGESLASGHHHSFRPRLAEGAWCARQRPVRAMMDLSDGLAKDLWALTPIGSEPALDAGSLPIRAGADLHSALGEGEDYELVFALAGGTDRAAFERIWRKAFPRTRLSCIGRFARLGDRPSGAVRLADYRGFEHLRRA